VLLIVGAVVSLLTIPVGVFEISLPELTPNQDFSDNPAGAAVLLLSGLFGLITIVIYIATAVTFLMWLYRSGNNLPAFGVGKRQIGYSPGWAVGSFFVPFVNLVVPYRAVREVWQKSEPPSTVSFSYAVSPPGFFPAWWGFWIASNIANNAHFRMTMADAPRDVTAMVGIVGEVLSIVAAVFAIMVVREIDRRQDESSKHLPASQGWPAPPPPPVFHPDTNLQTAPSAPSTEKSAPATTPDASRNLSS